MHPPGADSALVRRREIGTKRERAGRKTEAQLRDNIAATIPTGTGFRNCRRVHGTRSGLWTTATPNTWD